MLLFDEVLKFSREYNLPQTDHQSILIEYLQCEILDSLYGLSPNLYFIGGTCLRLFHNLPRFSEDLDFDNFDLKQEDFAITPSKEEAMTALKDAGYLDLALGIESLSEKVLEICNKQIKIKDVYKCIYKDI